MGFFDPFGTTDVGELKSDLNGVKSDVETHTNNNDIHVTASDKSNWDSKVDKNQGSENSGKVLGTNANGEVIPLNGYGFEYNEETGMLEYGTDPTSNLNQGIGLDDTLSKTGYAADAGAVGELKSDLGELDSRLSESIVEIDDNIFSKKEKGTDVSLVDSRTKVSSKSAIPYKSANAVAISFSDATAYDSYWFIVDKDADIYTKESDSMYYAFVHGVQYKGIIDNGWVLCEQSTRYRKSDGNLPTEDSKLHVSKGDVLAFTFPKDKSGYIYGLEYTKEVSAIFANKVFANNLFDVTISENEISITLEKTKYYLRHVVSSVINVDCWRIYKGSLIDNGVEYVMWDGSDADGVIKLVGEEDFLGGFHGDEITKSVKCIIDGKEVDISTPSEFHCKSFQLYCDSDIYHCNTSADASRICFERTKIIEVCNNKMAVKNNYVAKENVSVVSAHLAMLSVAREQGNTTIIDSYTENLDYKQHGNRDTINTSARLNKCSVNTNCGVIKFEADKGSAQKYGGMVVRYDGSGVSNRLKWYFSVINATTANPITLNAGNEIYGEYTLEVV